MPESVAEFESTLLARTTAFIKERRLAGASVGVLQDGVVAWSAGVGFADRASRRAPDPDTMYRIASITKTFTGTAIMQLVAEGRLHLDDPAVRHLPELAAALSPFGPIETVTIRRMLSHESGLTSEPAGTDWSTPIYEGLAARNLGAPEQIGTRVPPNTQQKYSNLAYQLLGEIVARVSGTPYPSYLEDRILRPLGLERTRFEPLPEPLRTERATGYMARAFSDELELAPDVPPVWAEGGLWSCASDLARWLAFQLSPYTDGKGDAVGAAGPVLAPGLLRDMHKPRYLSDDAWTEAWGVTWYAARDGDVVWIQHSGHLHGYSANACFDRKTRAGAVVLINGDAVNASELAMDLAGLARDRTLAGPAEIEPPSPTPEAYRSLLGWYADSTLAAQLRLEWRDGKLTFIDPATPEWDLILVPTDDADVFVAEPGRRQSGERVIFGRLPDGRVASVFLAAETLRRLHPAD